MYKFQPQKKRSSLRIKIGCIFFTIQRYFFWIKNNSLFTKNKILDFKIINDEFPYMIFSHSTPLYRNLSKEENNLQEAKVHNLIIAHKKINGAIIKPGKFLSYWKLIGNPSFLKGYKKGMVLHNGKPSSGIGGGLCALSNLIYWMVLHTPLSVLERWRHSYDVFPDSNRVLPFGSGATCVYNYRDLVIKNETDNEFIFLIKIENNKLCGEIRSKLNIDFEYEVYQKEHWITTEGPGIFVRHNTIYRKKINKLTKEIIEDVLITENHALMMYNPYIQDKTYSKDKN